MRLLLLSSFMLLSACVTASDRYEYSSPQTSSGMQCIANCASVRDFCTSQANLKYETCLKAKKLDRRFYESCESSVDPFRRGACLAPAPCAPPNIVECTNAYNACYTECGGQVSKRAQ